MSDIKHNKFAEMNGVILEDDTPETQQQIESQKEISEPEAIITTRQVWQQPWLKGAVIGSSILIVVCFLGGMISTTINAINSQSANKSQPEQVSKSPDINSNEEDSKGRIKAEMALTDQKGELKNLNKHQQTSEKPKDIKPSPLPKIVSRPQPKSQPKSQFQSQPKSQPQPMPQSQPKIVYRSQPSPPANLSTHTRTPLPQISQATPRRPVQTSTPVMPRVKPSPVDPMQQWIAVSNIGSYGSRSEIDDSTSPKSTEISKIQGGSGLIKVSNNSEGGSTTNVQAPNPNNDYSGKRVLVGSHVEGRLETPIAWSGNNSNQVNQNYLIKLSQPLKASDGAEVLPIGSYFVVRINHFLESGLVQMQATSALINVDGRTEEKNLPENSILILSKSGKLLKAESHRGSNLGSSLMTSILSGVAKAAEIQNRPTSQTSINSVGVSTVTSNDKKDLATGFAEGSFNELLREIQSSNQQQLQKLQSEPKVFAIESGTAVQIFVNQTVSL
jgi:Bacterial conjugation TrbI-like protein